MSAKAVGWALEQPLDPLPKIILVTLADCLNTETLKCYPSQQFIAGVARCSTRTVSTHLGQLEESGYLERVKRNHPVTGHRLSDGYVLGLPETSSGRPTGSPTQGQPEAAASGEPEGNQKSLLPDGNRENAQARPKPVTYHGQRVPKEMVDSALRLLSEFNVVVRRNLGAYKTDGTASTSLKQIIGAMMEQPGTSEGQWVTAIRNVMMNPPDWVDGQLQLGHVFGPKASAHALSNTGQRSNGNAKIDSLSAYNEDTERRMRIAHGQHRELPS